MTTPPPIATGTAQHIAALNRNLRLFPWFKFAINLLFWQSVWFLVFQERLSAAEAVLLYAVFDLVSTALEVPSGYMSDRIGRRFTLICAALAGALGATVLALGTGFYMLALGQALLGVSVAFVSGTDSSLLFETLSRLGRADETERYEIIAWRYTFAGLALSAFTGGVLSLWSPALAFAASGVAFTGALILSWQFREPPRRADETHVSEIARLRKLAGSFRQPVVTWIFALGVVMYVFSHIPYVFGQPFIDTVLRGFEAGQLTPLVSGSVTTVMMVLSLLASLVATRLRARFGLVALVLFAFGLQIAISGTLALTVAAPAIAMLFLRMVPDAFSWPFMVARIQPLLAEDSRATFLSIKSFLGRLIFAGSLLLAYRIAPQTGVMEQEQMRVILGAYTVLGLAALAVFALTARRAGVEARGKHTRV